MIGAHIDERPLAVVCGTTFGQMYLQAFARVDMPFKLGGILAQGSERSRNCAMRFKVPLYTDPTDLPPEIKVACVVVRSGAMGGRGTELARTLMARGIHVLQEQPVHYDEVADCIAQARRYGVVYRVNGFYPWLVPVRRFIAAARQLLTSRCILYVDAACSVQVSYPLFDILGQVLGGLRPWSVNALPGCPEQGTAFRSMEGSVMGVPLTLRIQNQIDPGDPDNHLHLLHRITVGTDGGTLTLVDTHGPVLFQPSLYVPPALMDVFDAEGSTLSQLDLRSAIHFGPKTCPSFREVFGMLWPQAVCAAFADLQRAIVKAEDPRCLGQYQLAVSRLWHECTAALGYPEMVPRAVPTPLTQAEIESVDKAQEGAML